MCQILLSGYFREALKQRVWGTSLSWEGPRGPYLVTIPPFSLILLRFCFRVLTISKNYWSKAMPALRAVCVVSLGALAGWLANSVEWNGEHRPPGPWARCLWIKALVHNNGSWKEMRGEMRVSFLTEHLVHHSCSPSSLRRQCNVM